MTPPHKPGPGRPPNPERGSSVSIWLPERQHDQLVAIAREREQSVSSLARAIVTERLRAKVFSN